MDLNLTHILFELNSTDSVSLLPRLYEAVRHFDRYFKSVSCPHAEISCDSCNINPEACSYQKVFGQLLSSDPEVVRRHQKPPLPFVFKISMISNVSSCIELSLVVAGTAIQHLRTFVSAVTRMLSAIAESTGVDAEISSTWCLDHQGERHALDTDSQELTLLSGMEILQTANQSDVIRIVIDTPLRLMNGGSVSHSFDFCALFRSQMRRCSSFFAYYGESGLDVDYVSLSRAAERVTTLDYSYSFCKPLWSDKVSLCGIMGVGEFTDIADCMFPLLLLGSYLNAGKCASYGMGVYRIE